MTRNPLILYDAKIALYFEGQWLLLDAITELSGDTSIRQQGPNRKTLFGYAPPQLQAREYSSFSITLTTYITRGFRESVFFRMAGFHEYEPRRLVLSYPEKLGDQQKEATIYVISPAGQYCLTGCQVESIDLPFQLDKVGQTTITLSARTLQQQDSSLLSGVSLDTQGDHMPPGPVITQLSGYEATQVGQSVTFQRQYTQLSQVNCFNTDLIVPQGARIVGESNFGGVIQEYVTKDRLDMQDSMYTDFEVSQSGLRVRQVNGVATKRLGIQSVHSLYWDFKATETIEISGPQED